MSFVYSHGNGFSDCRPFSLEMSYALAAGRVNI
ncbi:MAG: hypothetical protein BWY75_03837 [bacterium ADurb.Bin425]|nr:MAG: hypothetical protein BWY75_03837 [bacterium ADurb.Bin425]